ncbi:glycosyltransferase [Sphingomonas prati]|uniref:UDP:flavonoid glycosyltransferase YjiC (YdhE family) n=1 Tax=Sphingomonas prati TaxID=1843237 RepID=A0A7W9F2V2_9SPHN|nr:glycosyltransferase [Sphingomonas prati]MBB5730741.1 UDP:flavonoid glycosyltransferase YjiC (YdhE family) [Sphingomonas prati]GGE95623.1 glucosyltransferase [Sphingomonas prati]
MARIVLVTIGSLGDLHPFIAIGRALVAQGHGVVLAVPEDGVAKVRGAGLDAAGILPGYRAICARVGLSAEAVAARILDDPNYVIDEILMPTLQSSTAALDALAVGADVIAGSIFALSAGIVAEKRGLPLASVVLQPMTLFSAWRPPAAPRFAMMRHDPRSVIGRGWNRAFFALARIALRRRHGARIDAVRAEHGLGPAAGAPMLDHGAATKAVLCCWSSALGMLPPDAPACAALVGFPFFDSESGGTEELAPEIEAFLRDGDAPIVFTLGSFAVAAPGGFYERAAEISRALGRRALLLTGQAGAARREGNCLFVGYAAHSAVFPRASIVVHHGGAGTTGQALRAGRPQVIVPHFGDQHDNAARVVAAGLGRTIGRGQFDLARGKAVIAGVLADRKMATRAEWVARHQVGDDGAAEAARRIVALV